MSLPESQPSTGALGFPRVSGDEPVPLLETNVRELFSPRERG